MPFDLDWPLRGIHDSAAAHRTPQGFAPFLQNARTISGADREGGGSRDGLTIPYTPVAKNSGGSGSTALTFGSQRIGYLFVGQMLNAQQRVFAWSTDYLGTAAINADGNLSDFKAANTFTAALPADPFLVSAVQTTATQTVASTQFTYPDAVIWCDGTLWKFLGPSYSGGNISSLNHETFTPSTTLSFRTAGTDATIPNLSTIFRARYTVSRRGQVGWFMSRVGEASDFNPGNTAVGESIRAVAGAGSLAGVPGDPIQALVSIFDDYLLFGCANSLWWMEGDPGYGGRVQILTRKCGIFGPRAYCFDEFGNFWFLGPSGLYVIFRGTSTPKPISGNRLRASLDRFAAGTGYGAYAHLAYDSFTREIHIHITGNSGAASGRVIVYDIDRDAFCSIEKHAIASVPLHSAASSAQNDQGRRFFVGTEYGMVMTHRSGVFNDDAYTATASAVTAATNPIEFIVKYPVLVSQQSGQEALIGGLAAEKEQESSTVAAYLVSKETAAAIAQVGNTQAAVAANGLSLGNVIVAGDDRAEPIGIREAAGAHQVVLYQNTANAKARIGRVQVEAADDGELRSV